MLFVKIRLYPDSKLKFGSKHYSKVLKSRKKQDKDKEKQKKSQSEGGSATKIVSILKLISSFISFLVKEFAPRLHVKLAKLHISVGSPDAAETAILYGAISGAVACIVDLIDEMTNLHPLKSKSIIVEPNFLSERCEAKINITLGLSVFSALKILFKLAWSSAAKKYLKENKLKGI